MQEMAEVRLVSAEINPYEGSAIEAVGHAGTPAGWFAGSSLHPDTLSESVTDHCEREWLPDVRTGNRNVEVLLAVQFLAEMRIVEALILAAGQFEDGAAQSRGQSPGHGPSAIAVMHPIDTVGTIAPLEPLHLPFTQLQQSSPGLTFNRPATAFSMTFTRWSSF
jgi:hypothetical protein